MNQYLWMEALKVLKAMGVDGRQHISGMSKQYGQQNIA